MKKYLHLKLKKKFINNYNNTQYIFQNIKHKQNFYTGYIIFINKIEWFNESYLWTKHNDDFTYISEITFKIIKEYDTIEEILIDIPELMLI